ncbi:MULTISPECIES: manganese efflux pump [Allobacillus]|uniref:Sporulation membrane protein YtaF n=1 Tax=Allobacillus salarius TaxID=1955272 RepID=A0A556PPY5_9BACI|nr:manganese efflux pump [Allobacillus salarius]TSJ66453.1 hypothetical protein FPQ13_04140 [Allobacillus salarius]
MSPYFIMILLSFAVSFDSFFFGFTFQLRSIQLRFRFVWLIGLVTGSCFVIGSWLGKYFLYVLPFSSESIGGMIFITIGLWVLYQWATEQKEKLKSVEPPWTIVDIWRVLKEPQEADIDRSGSIRGVEVFVVALALSLDSFATGIGTTFTTIPIYLLGLLVGIFSSLFLHVGAWTGKWFKQFHATHLFAWIPGMILIGIGISYFIG